ncbi:MAG TPA: 3-deoxy-D-manno-octulosonic acid transferase, partial [Bacteroidales bacterium]|nr:3-deoxy-D-manno-octulosonic acid transferase [Bacteroidales bacterium]
VFFGPNYYRFREAREMTAGGMAYSVTNSDELAQQVNGLLADREKLEAVSAKAGKYVQQRSGATKKIMDLLTPALR